MVRVEGRKVTETAPSPQKLRAEGMTKVQRISRALRSGRIRSCLRTAQEALWAAKALDQKIKAAGLDDKDRHVYIAYMTPDLAVLSTLPFAEGREQEIIKMLTGPGTCSIMVGLVYAMRDKEHGGEWLFAHMPFVAADNVVTALNQRVEAGPGLEGIN